MRAKLVFCAVLLLGLAAGSLIGPAFAQPGDTAPVPGDRVLIAVDVLPVHVQPDAASDVAAHLQINMRSQVLAAQEDDQGQTWYYLRDNAYGWVPGQVDGESPFISYVDGLLDERIAAATQAIEADPQDVQALIARGVAYMSSNQNEAALADFTAAIALDPENARLYDYRGKAYLDMDEPTAALNDLDQAIALGRNLSNTYNRKGIAYDNLGDASRASAAYDQAIALAPGYGLLYSNKANLTYSNDYNTTIAGYTQALELDPYLSTALVNRGNLYKNNGRYPQAYDDLNRAVEIDPWYGRGLVWRGIYYANVTGSWDLAFEDFNQAVMVDPEYANGWQQRGTAYAEIGWFEMSRSDLEKSVELDDSSEHAWFNLAYAYARLGQYEKAIDAYTKSMDLGDQYDSSACLYRGQVYAEIGQLNYAIADYEHYNWTINQSNSYFVIVGLLMEAHAYLQQGWFELARADFQNAYNVYPEMALGYGTWYMGWRVITGREDVLYDVQSQVQADPNNADLQFQMGILYLEFGQWKQASEHLHQYLELAEIPGPGFENFLATFDELYAQ